MSTLLESCFVCKKPLPNPLSIDGDLFILLPKGKRIEDITEPVNLIRVCNECIRVLDEKPS